MGKGLKPFINSLSKNARGVVLVPTEFANATPFVPHSFRADASRMVRLPNEKTFLSGHFKAHSVYPKTGAWDMLADFFKNHGILDLDVVGVMSVNMEDRRGFEIEAHHARIREEVAPRYLY
ncbi:TPA: hypothetical protein HA318_06200 [Candidatus Micrarchaeota archaeon]|nr:MAG: hypothetical protein AUJ65_06355 [Candidatus Micrarchaeota archaeon CG1_02_51_15]HII39562.1 hypothetical protein [Candidatus Micrarchaeota archaeon]